MVGCRGWLWCAAYARAENERDFETLHQNVSAYSHDSNVDVDTACCYCRLLQLRTARPLKRILTRDHLHQLRFST